MYAKKYRIILPTVFACSVSLMGACETAGQVAPTPAVEQVASIEHVQPTQPDPMVIPARPTAERMNESLVRAASNYAVLMNQINLIPEETIGSPKHMNQTMDGLIQVFSPSLGPALIGYGALIGAQSSDFVEGVLRTAKQRGVDSVIYQLYVNPNYAVSLPGALSATSDIQISWTNDIASIDRSSAHIKSQSYSMQKEAKWKKKRADSRTERLQVINKSQSLHFVAPEGTAQQIAEVGTIRAGDISGSAKRQQFWQAYGRAEQPKSENSTLNYIGVMQRKALTLSALEILGATGAESSEWIEDYMASPRLTQCVNTARLNTEQCIAAVHFKYEDAFCIAAHQLKEISNCMSGSAL
ncbi:MAG: hypothetical protein COB56_03395 [Robiginitomaculum sp.]|nr:MAG: hypothetical protein COB56_03395 [Robiginitomaculum sp.]